MERNDGVLVVTADAALSGALCQAAAWLGLRATSAATAAEALHRLSDDPPAAIVVDLAFRDIDPERIVHRALVCRETHGSAVLLLGANVDAASREVWLGDGCSDVLDRASDPREIARVLATRLRPGTAPA